MVWRWVWGALAPLFVIGFGGAVAQTAPSASPPIAFGTPASAPPAQSDAAVAQTPPAPVPSASPGLDAAAAKVEAALDNALTLERPGQIGLATVWYGNPYVQCRATADKLTLCEAAGTVMQPSLARILTPERLARLAALGWKLDTHFGNYVQVFPSNVTARDLAAVVMQALAEGYGADLAELEVRSAWVAKEACPPRIGSKQTLAGSINDVPTMASVAIHACSYAPAPEAAIRSAADLVGVYGPRITGEMKRLIVNHDDHMIHVVLDTDTGYVQCAPDTPPPSIFCEAASADSMPMLDQILTPERIARLHAFGFIDPGRGPNYYRATALETADPGVLARDLLTILYEVYGYRGKPKLRIMTE